MKETFFETKKSGEGEPDPWEGEPTFTAKEIIAAVKELDGIVADVEITEQRLSQEGVILKMEMRAPESATGYSFTLKGGGRNFLSRTAMTRIDYDGPDSEDIAYAEEIAEYKNGAWVK